MTRLDGKKALITDAAKGMGAEIAKYWTTQEAAVCVSDVNEEGLEKVAEEIKADGGQATLIELHVTDEDQAVAAAEHTAKTFVEIN